MQDSTSSNYSLHSLCPSGKHLHYTAGWNSPPVNELFHELSLAEVSVNNNNAVWVRFMQSNTTNTQVYNMTDSPLNHIPPLCWLSRWLSDTCSKCTK